MGALQLVTAVAVNRLISAQDQGKKRLCVLFIGTP